MKNPIRRGLERFVSRCVAVVFSAIVRVLPLACVRALGRAMGRAIFAFTWRRQRLADENIVAAFGDKYSARERRRIRLRCTQNIVTVFFELFKMPSMGLDGVRQAMRVEGMDKMHAAIARGKGVMVITAHYGNWEMGGARMVAEGLNVAVVARDASDAGVASIVNGCREALGVRVLDRQDLRAMLRQLRGKDALAMLPDQHHKRGAIRLEFLGRPAWVAPGPATLAVRTGCAIVPVFCPRAEDGTLSFEIWDEIEIDPSLERDEVVAVTTQRINDAMGEAIRRDPAQWLWLHDRWKDTQRGVENTAPTDPA